MGANTPIPPAPAQPPVDYTIPIQRLYTEPTPPSILRRYNPPVDYTRPIVTTDNDYLQALLKEFLSVKRDKTKPNTFVTKSVFSRIYC